MKILTLDDFDLKGKTVFVRSGYEYEPEITIRKEGTKRIEEHRVNGNPLYNSLKVHYHEE